MLLLFVKRVHKIGGAEVADTSRETDLGAKRELYARAGIREFWIVDLTTDGVPVGRNPGGDR